MTEASAFVLDGAAIADEVLARVGEEARALVSSGVTPGLAVVLVGENPASRTYVASKGREAKTRGFHSIQHNLPVDTTRSGVADADPGAQRRSGRARHPRAIAAARGHRFDARPGSDRARQGRRRLSPDQCRPLVDRRYEPRAHSLHARRRDDPHRPGLRAAWQDASRHGGGDRRPLEHRRQADGAAVAQAPLHGDHRPFAHSRSACGRAPRRRAGRRRRPAGNGARRLGQAGRDRDRRRHQPRARRRRPTRRASPRRVSSATSPMRKPPRSPARSRRCQAASAG